MFRKSISLGKGVRLNVSKKGLGVSAGVKGFRVSAGPSGVRRTVSIPGTGLYHTQKIGSSTKSSRKRNNITNVKVNSSAPKRSVFEESKEEPMFPAVTVYTKFYANLLFLLAFSFIITKHIFIGSILAIFAANLFRKSSKKENIANIQYTKAIEILNKNSDIAAALEYLDSGLESDPNNVHILRAKSIIYYIHLKDYKNAIINAEKTKALGYTVISMDILLGDCYFKTGEFDKGIDMLLPYAESDEIKLNISKAYYQAENYTAAMDMLKKGPVLKRTYDNTVLEFKYWLGLTYLKLEEKQKAKTQLKKVYEVNPEFMDIQSYIQQLNIV